VTIQGSVGSIRRILVKAPDPRSLESWRDYGWRAAPDAAIAAREHAAFRDALADHGAEVVVAASTAAADPDAIYVYDPVLLTDRGSIMLRPGKRGRRDEVAAVESDLVREGIPVLGRLAAPATAEGGDMFWLDEHTLLIGRGYRTNADGMEQLRALLGSDIEVVAFDLPHARGPDSCLHLMSFISPLDRDLAVVYPPMVPVRLMELLRDRDIAVVEVPDEEFDSMGPNVLALAPRVALALDGNPRTRRRMESAGVEVHAYAGDEISRKGDGGPTCLTRALERD
jgi:N-dimethylarginine dimethylaminohydrolase